MFCTQKCFTPATSAHTQTKELTFHLPEEQRQGDVPDHEKPHPVKKLKSKYLNCSWALICMLEKLLNFVSLPTDFTVQVLSRKKKSELWSTPSDLPAFPLLYALPPPEGICSVRPLQTQRFRPEMMCSNAISTKTSTLHMRKLVGILLENNWTTYWGGEGQLLDSNLHIFAPFLFLFGGYNLSHKLQNHTIPWINSKLLCISVSHCAGDKHSLVHNL